MSPQAPRRVTDPEVLKGLTHPLRREAYRLLAQFGPATVSTLAERTGSDPGRLSYHLRQLATRGFIEPAPEFARDRRESWWRVVPEGVSFSSTDMDDPAGRAVADTVHDLIVSDEFERLQVFDETAGKWGSEWKAASQTSNSYLRLTPAELSELGQRVNELIRDFGESEGRRADRPRGDDQADDGRESVFIFFHGFPEKP